MKLLFFLLLLSLSGNDPSENRIDYKALSWSDYKGKVPEKDQQVAARTCTEMELEITEYGPKYHYAVRAYFLPDSSFVRTPNDDILLHEQTHFDIAHVAAMRCTKRLAKFKYEENGIQKQVGDIYRVAFHEMEKLQEQFDEESQHGLNAKIEKAWEDRIQQQLKYFGNERTKNP